MHENLINQSKITYLWLCFPGYLFKHSSVGCMLQLLAELMEYMGLASFSILCSIFSVTYYTF